MRAFLEAANRAFASWVSNRAYRSALLMVVFPPVAWALSILDVLRRGNSSALMSVLLAAVGLAVLSMFRGGSPVDVLQIAVPLLLVGVALGVLLSASGNLALAFQAAVLGSILLVLVLFSLWPGLNQIGAAIRQSLLAIFEAGAVRADQLAEFEALDPSLFTFAILFMLEIALLIALMLGYWWYSLVQGEIRFGAAFRALRLGRVAGILLMVLVTLQWVVGSRAIQYAAGMALVGFLFQGLAVLHARSHSDHWHWAIVFLVYVSLFTPLAGIVIMLLSAAGLLDNVFRLRAQAAQED